jgi:hypothetical protein
MTVVCIAGMHRSGTSMIAKLLSQCGVYLGGQEELMLPDHYNADGYWENLEFVDLNNSLLLHFNSTWKLPPASNLSFDLTQIPESLTGKAQDLIQRFKGQKIWGWKDPRNSITLPFWQQLIPNLKVIVCLRNPLEVAQSLSSRDNFPRLFSFDLWHTYNERLLLNTPIENRLVTPYNAYFINPQGELGRVLEFIDCLPEKDVIQTACDATISPLRHNYTAIEDLVAAGAPLKVIDLYMEMARQTQTPDWEIFKLLKKKNTISALSKDPDLESKLILKLTKKDSVTQTLISYLTNKEHEMETIVNENEQALKTLTAELNLKQDELQGIYNSRAWRFVLALRRIRQAITH